MRHVLDTDDLSPVELTEVLDLCEKPPSAGLLTGRSVGLIFEKPSLRTRNASEAAVVQLGGHPVSIFHDEIRLDEREPIEDATRVLAGYYALLGARVFAHSKVERMAASSTVPVVNLLSDDAHPCQTIADLLTIRQRFGALQGLELAWVGDFTNVARSLTLGSMLTGVSVRVAAPPTYGPAPSDIDRAAARATGGATLRVCGRPEEALHGANVVVTDSFVSMGKEKEAEVRRKAFEGFRVDEAMMAQAAADAVFMHCLPAHRGDEVAAAVIDGPQSVVIAEAHNRMHAFRGLATWLLS